MTIKTFLAALGVALLAQSGHAAQPAQLVAAAKKQIGVTVRYDPRYEKLAYPGGDVPLERGVCTDPLCQDRCRVT